MSVSLVVKHSTTQLATRHCNRKLASGNLSTVYSGHFLTENTTGAHIMKVPLRCYSSAGWGPSEHREQSSLSWDTSKVLCNLFLIKTCSHTLQEAGCTVAPAQHTILVVLVPALMSFGFVVGYSLTHRNSLTM